MLHQTEITTQEFLEQVKQHLSLKPEDIEVLATITRGLGIFKETQRWNSVQLSRTLLGLGLKPKQITSIMGIDTQDIASNNNARVGLGDTPNKPLSHRELRNDPRYNKKFSREEYELLKLNYPNIKEYEGQLVA
jgi:hypothetical protein